MFRAASETSSCFAKAPFQSDSINSPFHTRFGVPLWEYYQKYPEKGVRFARAMAGITKGM